MQCNYLPNANSGPTPTAAAISAPWQQNLAFSHQRDILPIAHGWSTTGPWYICVPCPWNPAHDSELVCDISRHNCHMQKKERAVQAESSDTFVSHCLMKFPRQQTLLNRVIYLPSCTAMCAHILMTDLTRQQPSISMTANCAGSHYQLVHTAILARPILSRQLSIRIGSLSRTPQACLSTQP